MHASQAVYHLANLLKSQYYFEKLWSRVLLVLVRSEQGIGEIRC